MNKEQRIEAERAKKIAAGIDPDVEGLDYPPDEDNLDEEESPRDAYERETPAGTFTLEIVNYEDRWAISGRGPHDELVEPGKNNYPTIEKANTAFDSMVKDFDSFADALDEEDD